MWADLEKAIILGCIVLSGTMYGAVDRFSRIEKLKEFARSYTLQRLVLLNESNDLKTPKYTLDPNINTNPNLTPFGSETTYHSYATHYCKQWVYETCTVWLQPHEPEHGLEGEDASTLERRMSQISSTKEGDNPDPTAQVIGKWRLEPKDEFKEVTKDFVTVRGTQQVIDPNKLKRYELIPEASQAAEQIGMSTSEKAIIKTKVNGKIPDPQNPDRLPSEMDLRMMAGRFTEFYKWRLLQTMGDLRVNNYTQESPIGMPIHFQLGLSAPDCQSFYQQLRDAQDRNRQDPNYRTAILNYYDYRNRRGEGTSEPEAALEMCKMLQTADGSIPNPTLGPDGKVIPGDPNQERIDAALARINYQTIASGGIMRNEVQVPSYLNLTDNDFRSQRADYAVGGRGFQWVSETNAETINQWNEELRDAEEKRREIAQRCPDCVSSTPYTSGVIPRGTDLSVVNGLTGAMKDELSVAPRSNLLPTLDDREGIESTPFDLINQLATTSTP